MGFSVILWGAENLVPAEYWCPYGTSDLFTSLQSTNTSYLKVIWSIGNVGSSPYSKNNWKVFLKLILNYEMSMFGSVIWNKVD